MMGRIKEEQAPNKRRTTTINEDDPHIKDEGYFVINKFSNYSIFRKFSGIFFGNRKAVGQQPVLVCQLQRDYHNDCI